MRQLPLLSLVLGTALGVAAASCSGDSRLQPIVDISARSSASAGASNTGGTENFAGTSGVTEEGGAAAGTSESTGGSAPTAGASNTGGTATGGTTPTGGTPGSGGTDVQGGCNIFPDTNGWVAAESNACGVQGAWYSYSDCTTSPTDCTLNLLPVEGAEFINANGRMCTSGSTASINDTSEVDIKWGAGIGLSLNQQQGSTARDPIASLPYPLFALRFTISGTTIPEEIRVNLPTPTTERLEHFVTISTEGEHTIYVSAAQQGDWVVSPTALDPSQITAVQFQVPAKFNEVVAFDYCVENLQYLY